MILPVIMAGGTGSRLWPLSRELFPKQYLRLSGDDSMLQETILRLEGLNTSAPIIICNEQHRFLAAEQLRQIGQLKNNIILEPVGRNTAPAVALAALSAINKNDEDPLLLVLAADHVIEDIDSFHMAINKAISYADGGKLVTFGIVATGPETGYGYIQRGEQSGSDGYNVCRFVEKPDIKTAQTYLDTGEYYWNSGMFLFRAKRYLEELRKYRPDILDVCIDAIQNVNKDSIEDFVRVSERVFASCPDESIDYAVMEKTTDAVVIPLNAGWNDVGSWSALWEVSERDKNN
ncbi:TPA: mannose-1-phosphate guanylyltransferase/mannose-6-phosphate isomerase, partial [Klebsiella pneumoniae]|nr:mannose-1-phosphate guanylyltransferase/mannose-6-phosphate isomerase [Klebsiella pneumoniae]